MAHSPIFRRRPHRAHRLIQGLCQGICAAALALASLSCIERSNPFDPLNSSPSVVKEIRGQNRPLLDSLLRFEPAFASYLKDYLSKFGEDSAANAELIRRNNATRTANEQIRSGNASLEISNRSEPDPSQLKRKSRFGGLDTLNPYVPDPDFQLRILDLRNRTLEVTRFATGVNESRGLLVYDKPFLDSVLRPFILDSIGFARLQAAIAKANAAVSDSNVLIRGYERERGLYNASVDGYNDSIDFLKQTQGKVVITQSDSLTAIVKTAKAGDTLFLGAGVFEVELAFSNSGTVDNPIVVRGYPGQGSILRAMDINGGTKPTALVLSNNSYIRLEGLVFRKGGSSGVRLVDDSEGISFRNCKFDSNGVWGLEAFDSDLDMRDCQVVGNGGGIQFKTPPTSKKGLTLNNVLVAGNRGNGLETVTPQGLVKNCTFANNTGKGIWIIDPLRNLNIDNSIVSSNGGIGILHEPPSADASGRVAVEGCDLWNNHPDWSLPKMPLDDSTALVRANLYLRTEFVDSASFNYGLVPGSELSNLESLPLIIGYRP